MTTKNPHGARDANDRDPLAAEATQFEGATAQERTRESVVDALLKHRIGESRASVDQLVARAMDRVHADSDDTGPGVHDAHGAPSERGTARRFRVGAWSSGIAAALLFTAIVIFGQPSTANALLEQARAAERVAGDRRYKVTVELPAPRLQAVDANASHVIHGILDVRDATHMKLAITMPDGRQTVRAKDGSSSWVQHPDGTVLRLPEDAPWPRWVETPSGELLVDRLDALLDDVAGHYTVQKCGGAAPEGAETVDRVCATKRDGDFRGPESIELWTDAKTHAVVRAKMEFARLPMVEVIRGEAPRREGIRGEGNRGEGNRGEGARSEGARPQQDAANAKPKTITIAREELPAEGLADSHFAPPSTPKEPPAQMQGQQRGLRDGKPGEGRPNDGRPSREGVRPPRDPHRPPIGNTPEPN